MEKTTAKLIPGMARPRGTDEAKVIQVIRTKSLRGSGTMDDVSRQVTQYWSFEGELLAETDPVDETISSVLQEDA